VPGADDIMLNYQSLSFHDMLYLRSAFGVRAAPEFEAWLERMDMVGAGGHIRELSPKGSDIARMLAFPKASQ